MTSRLRFLSCLLATMLVGTTLATAADQPAAAKGEKKKIAFMAGRPSHGYGAHEHYAGCMLLADGLKNSLPNIEVEVFRNGWPQDPNAFDGADTIVVTTVAAPEVPSVWRRAPNDDAPGGGAP